MKQDFLRQLTTPVPDAAGEKLFETFSKLGIEIYGRKTEAEGFQLLHSAKECPDGIFYVSAADREEAVKLLSMLDLSEYVSENIKVMSEEEKYVEHATEEYYRKRRVTMLECLVVLLAVMLYYMIRTWT
jgi:hypothetical protein